MLQKIDSVTKVSQYDFLVSTSFIYDALSSGKEPSRTLMENMLCLWPENQSPKQSMVTNTGKWFVTSEGRTKESPKIYT